MAAAYYGQYLLAKHEQYLKCGVVAEPAQAGVAVCKVAAQAAADMQLKQLTLSQVNRFKFVQQVVDAVAITIRPLMDAQAGYVHKAAAEHLLGLLVYPADTLTIDVLHVN